MLQQSMKPLHLHFLFTFTMRTDRNHKFMTTVQSVRIAVILQSRVMSIMPNVLYE